MQSLVGTGVALVTPFKKDLSVDVDALKRIVNFQIDNQIEYLVVLGTTAENVTLTDQEKNLIIQTVIESNNKRLPLVLGVGGSNTAKVIEELNTRDLSGFDAILSVSPLKMVYRKLMIYPAPTKNVINCVNCIHLRREGSAFI